MTYILILFTVLPAWFVGPLPSAQIGGVTVYYEGPSLALPLQPTPDGLNRTIIVVDPPAPGPGPWLLGPQPPAPRPPRIVPPPRGRRLDP